MPPSQPPTSNFSESSLQSLLDNGLTEAVQQILNAHPELKYKIEDGNLVDCVTGAELHLKRFITSNEEMLSLKRDAMKIANVDDEVLITGETGTGKEIIARAMIGDRVGKFVPVNCAGLPDTLIEAELFGHTSQAFTGATKAKAGMMEEAKGGVLFLDEIGELPLSVQGKLLRAIQEKRIRRIGENDEREISCRFVCATHRNLAHWSRDGRFRVDLYARISTFELHIIPLRERKEDIKHIIKEIGKRLKCPSVKIDEFLTKYENSILNDELNLDLNVRSIEKYLKRYILLGKI